MSDILLASKAKISQAFIVLGIFLPNSFLSNVYRVCFFANIEGLDFCVGILTLSFCIFAGGIVIFTPELVGCVKGSPLLTGLELGPLAIDNCAICYLAPLFVPLVPEGCFV